jgi:predicted Zn-dependent peptidase
MIELSTLDNGLKVITETKSDSKIACVQIGIKTGSVNDPVGRTGLSHFLEHMLFKGTKTRSSFDISNTIESLGGYINAGTGYDYTYYHIECLNNDIYTALNILLDMMNNSNLDVKDISRERNVILQEIKMNQDAPNSLIFDHFFKAAYPSTLGRPILGNITDVKSIRRNDFENYLDNWYLPQNMIISVVGDIDHVFVLDYIDNKINEFRTNFIPKNKDCVYHGGDSRKRLLLQQIKFMLGFESRSATDDISARYAARMMAMFLGEGQSSRLFQEIREKRGLVYSIGANTMIHDSTGSFYIYAGTDEKNITELIPILCDEILNAQKNITKADLNKIRNKLIMNIYATMLSPTGSSTIQISNLLSRGIIYYSDEIIQAINNITIEDIYYEMSRTFSSKPTIVAIGPIGKLESYDKICDRLQYRKGV